MTARAPHPGTILKQRFLEPLGITPYRLAKSIGVSTRRVSELVKGNRSISPNTAIRLGLFFNVPPTWWLELQARYDTEGVPIIKELQQQVTQYEGLGDVLVSPTGVKRLEKPKQRNPGAMLVAVPDELMQRLRAQAALDPPRVPRQTHTITYDNGATALQGDDE